MNNTTLGTIIVNGMNNPDCSFYVGTFMGVFLTFRVILLIVVGFFVFKIIDSLIINPILGLLNKLIRRKFNLK